jgi:hypothetical protein
MRLRTSSNMLRRHSGPSEAQPTGPETSRQETILDGANVTPVEGSPTLPPVMTDDAVSRTISELTHDLRQPLTSLNMNLQSAVRLLQQPNPHVAAALDALSDCLSTERDMVELLARARRRVTALAVTDEFALNDLARDIVLAAGSFEPSWRERLSVQLADPSPLVASGAMHLRLVLLNTLRRALILEDCGQQTSTALLLRTRALDHRAELCISGLPPTLPEAPSFEALHQLTTSLVSQLNGDVRLAVQDARAALVLSLPTAPSTTARLTGGNHGD